jgi:hypothetical protein
MGHHEPVDVDPKSLESAQSMWGNFKLLTKYSIFAVVGVLALMALLLL